MRHEMKLQAWPFERIVSGKKIYEIRLNDEKRKAIKVGDIVEFRQIDDEQKMVKVLVEDLAVYETFLDMAQALGSSVLGYEENVDSNKIVEDYRQYYTREQEEKFGVLAIKINVI